MTDDATSSEEMASNIMNMAGQGVYKSAAEIIGKQNKDLYPNVKCSKLNIWNVRKINFFVFLDARTVGQSDKGNGAVGRFFRQ